MTRFGLYHQAIIRSQVNSRTPYLYTSNTTGMNHLNILNTKLTHWCICTQFVTYTRVVMSFIKIPLNKTFYNYRP